MPDKSTWQGIIDSVKNPLGFFALALLISEAALTISVSTSGLEPTQKMVTVWIMAGEFVLVVVLVFILAYSKPKHLYAFDNISAKADAMAADASRPASPAGPAETTKAALEQELTSLAAQASGLMDDVAAVQAGQSTMPGVFIAAREKAKQAACMSNLKQLALAALMYSQDNNERLPSVEAWSAELEVYHKGDRRILHCPAFAGTFGYAMNANMSGVSLSQVGEPSRTVLFFDTDADAEDARGADETHLSRPGRHLGHNNIVFVDGHVETVGSAKEKALRWSPQ